jgi:hypothetical protein
MEREALKLALEAFRIVRFCVPPAQRPTLEQAATKCEAALAQPAHSEWNAALDEAAARIGEMKGFGQATQDSFAVYIKGLKK